VTAREAFRAARSQHRLGQREPAVRHEGVPELAYLNAWARPSYTRPLCDEARIAIERRFGHRAATFLPRHQPTKRVSRPRYLWEREVRPMIYCGPNGDRSEVSLPSPMQRFNARRELGMSLRTSRRLTYVELPA
jgi:hypothetical protein